VDGLAFDERAETAHKHATVVAQFAVESLNHACAALSDMVKCACSAQFISAIDGQRKHGIAYVHP
jgi:hypothetical protein